MKWGEAATLHPQPGSLRLRTLLQRHPNPSAAQFAKEAIDPILGASYRM
jgi:hypothetical protein